ncbi:hypothetical protein Tco_1164150 [Tanacetum coccineum]
MNGGTTISWCSQKQTLAATSSNHVEVLALHEASRECIVSMAVPVEEAIAALSTFSLETLLKICSEAMGNDRVHLICNLNEPQILSVVIAKHDAKKTS